MPSFATHLTINGRRIGSGEPCYLIAEMSANHGGSYDRAADILRAARDAGADAVKLQTYTPDGMTLDAVGGDFQLRGSLWHGRRLHDLYAEAAMPWEWQPGLLRLAGELEIDLFSSAYDAAAVDFLEGLGVPAYKVASFELVDLPLLRRVGRTGKPVVLSTGMASLAEIEEAACTLYHAGTRQLALLKCTSAYPAPPAEMNLRTIPDLARRFGLPTGLSDHTLSPAVPVAAVALGACILEKHLTLARADGGPDTAFSLEPDELAALVRDVRTAEAALGEAAYGPTADEAFAARYRRSLFAVRDLQPGEALTPDNVRSIRPAGGLHPRHYEEVLGCLAAGAIARGTPLAWELIARKL